ncbi:HD domain-containing protein [Draconibacterium sp. IB214405]|uniref:HD domain-containing protein n=1 Tax=Draconibacterium sp. IB214405 TaxID=3097352 RepID=UPI002A174C7C|nr:HD domain-containing protein [Draconibacterium sp. IB214405]MDX8338303.1 HD domain-containing protein [Draconibacterium sp. IB214405]
MTKIRIMESNIQQKELISATEHFIKQHFAADSSGHDWFHIDRVRNMALKLAETEGGNRYLIEMAALLHDLDDWKLGNGENFSKTKQWFQQINIDLADAEKIEQIIKQVSFKGAGVETRAENIEAKIVQDADRLDAIGAIGIARTFAYGGNKQRLLYDPEIEPELHNSFEEYKKTTAPTINHFYEKLLLLKDRMNTKTAKEIAEKRHVFMEDYLAQFFLEWGCKK